MSASIDVTIPVVGVCNNAEVIRGFLERAGARHEIERKLRRGDRALLWLGGRKLIITSTPIPHVDYLRRQYGYGELEVASPRQPTSFLSRDIVADDQLAERIVAYAGDKRAIQLVPYANTCEFLALTQTLRDRFGLSVTLPESPTPDNHWVCRYVDSKSGFRALASEWLSDADRLLLEGFVAHGPHEAAEMVCWFLAQGRICIVKADLGESGLGHSVFRPGDWRVIEDVASALQSNPYLSSGAMLVEAYLDAQPLRSPSLELFVPVSDAGPPQITYLSDQLFLDGVGSSCGVLISGDLEREVWYPVLAEAGLTIACNLQRMGYVGHFDVDTVLSGDDDIYLLEVNARRTAGTHAHEFGLRNLGPKYAEECVVLCHNKVSSEGATSLEALVEAIGDLAWPMEDGRSGVVISATSGLESGEIGCIFVAPTKEEAVAQLQTVTQRLGAVTERPRGM